MNQGILIGRTFKTTKELRVGLRGAPTLQDTYTATLDVRRKHYLREGSIRNKHVIESKDESTSWKIR